jgi:two-component system response regulator RegX3
MSLGKVLIVDDEPDVRQLLYDFLTGRDYEVVLAAGGLEAIDMVEREKPDLVLLDLMLPELSGLEVTRRIRAESATPIVMLTARDAEVDKVVGLELGADDYVTKPFSFRELSARIRAVLRRGEQAGAPLPPLVELGGVKVDLAGHRVLRDGAEIPVKPKVFELLAFLLRHPGQVVTRDQLLEQVWGYDYPGETRTVDVHVHWLRSAVEDDPSRPVIIGTVRGTGYVLRRPA